MNRDPVKDFWFPDIYIDKAKAVRKPTYQVPPAYLRIFPSGRLLYSARVNYDLSCPMDFQYYPVSFYILNQESFYRLDIKIFRYHCQ